MDIYTTDVVGIKRDNFAIVLLQFFLLWQRFSYGKMLIVKTF